MRPALLKRGLAPRPGPAVSCRPSCQLLPRAAPQVRQRHLAAGAGAGSRGTAGRGNASGASKRAGPVEFPVGASTGLAIRLAEATGASFGARIWPSSKLLVAHLAALAGGEEAGAVAGKRVLELGSGVGLAGIAAAALGARVVMTDKDEVSPKTHTHTQWR